MGLPETVRVKLSSETAEYISVTPVVVQELPVRGLIELMLGVTGKNVERIRELLRRGTLVSGASRFRWTGWEAEAASIEALLATFPDPDPARPFSRERCVHAVLTGPHCRIELSREAGARRRFLRRTTFWQVLMDLAAGAGPRYLEYSYRERADCYRLEISSAAAALLRNNAGFLSYSSLEHQIRHAPLDRADFYVTR